MSGQGRNAQRLGWNIACKDEPEDGGACIRGSFVEGSGIPVAEGPGVL